MYAESPIQSQSRTVNGEVAVRIVSPKAHSPH
jgi:hypothetical protein